MTEHNVLHFWVCCVSDWKKKFWLSNNTHKVFSAFHKYFSFFFSTENSKSFLAAKIKNDDGAHFLLESPVRFKQREKF